MTEFEIDVEGLEEAIRKMEQHKRLLNKEMNRNMKASLDVLWDSVPPYPPKPAESEYRRTNTLAGSLGSSPGGGKSGRKPTVYSVTGSGGQAQGKFGTNLSYAPYVIDPQRQAYMHKPGYKGRQGWWTMNDIKERAKAKITKIWEDMVRFILSK